MRINQFSIDNYFLSIKPFELQLNQNEIYLIEGENGSGKTTMIESLVFDDYEAFFENEEEQKLYHTERGDLFAYLPQNIPEYPGTVYEYLKKGRGDFTKKDAQLLLKEYRCGHIGLSDSFVSLSGGERAQVALIATLAKNTPYIFLDEPTNSLDRSRIVWLKNVLENRKNCCVVVITHEPELAGLATQKIVFEHVIREKRVTRKKVSSRQDKNVDVASKKLFRSKINVIYAILLLAALAVVCNLVWSIEGKIYSEETLPPKNYIDLYNMDMTYAELNTRYAKARDLDISTSDYEKLFSMAMLPELIATGYVKDVYIKDMAYQNRYEFYDEEDREELTSPCICAVPEAIYADETFVNHMIPDEFVYIKEGRLPKDGAKEVVVSEKTLDKHGISKEEAIGATLNVEGEQYTIVGIGITNVYLISYTKEESHGIYCYDEGTFPQFLEQMKAECAETIFQYTLYDAMILVVEDGKEQKVLNGLLCEFPATNYYSFEFAAALKRTLNRMFYVALLIVTIVSSLLYGGSLNTALWSNVRGKHNKVEDYVNYYVNREIRRRYYQRYLTFLFVLYGCEAAILLGFVLRRRPEAVTVVAMIFFAVIVQIPGIIMAIKQKKELWEKNQNDC